MSPKTYLNDTAFGAAATRRFTAALDAAGPTLTPATVRAAAPELAAASADARLAWSRLSAARLDDTRLENQRRRVVPLLGRAVLSMEAVSQAAAQGRAREALAEVSSFRVALADLQAVGG